MRKKKTRKLWQLWFSSIPFTSKMSAIYSCSTNQKPKKVFLVCHIINILLTKPILYSHVHVVISLYGRILTLVMCTDLAVFFLFSHDLCQDSSIMQTSCLVNTSCYDFTLVCNCCSHMQKNSERTTGTRMLPGLYSRQFSTDLTVL